jgi:uncharacterized membrane protein
VKSLLWRFIGIIWTWIGAYFIILLLPAKWQTASILATLIVVYHHSTRMFMYYLYERVWGAILWGKQGHNGANSVMSPKEKLLWTTFVLVSLALIFYLIIVVTPMIKTK